MVQAREVDENIDVLDIFVGQVVLVSAGAV